MTEEHPSPIVLRRRLGNEMRRLRDAKKLTVEEVGKEMEWSRSKVSRMETGQGVMKGYEIEVLCDLYGASAEQRAALVQLGRQAKERGWWKGYRDAMPDWFEVYLGLESHARTISAYQAEFVPGLLQTEDYARAVLRVGRMDNSVDAVNRLVELRTARQARLPVESIPRYWAVLNEGVLRRLVGGPGVMRAQLLKLAEIAEGCNVTLQVVPFSAGAHAAMDGSFVLLQFDAEDDRDVAYLETINGSLYLDKDPEVERYRLTFERLVASALSPTESAALIAAAAKDLE
jgi:transcriptional regulator with XRE-family HTH domain